MKIASIPLGLGYIAAYLDEAGFSARILDMDMLNLHPGDLNKRLAQFQPDIVGITSFSSNYKNAVDVAKAVKSYDPGIKIVMGGVHATFTHEEILKSVPEVDIVVRYEGEHALSEIAESLEGGRTPTDVLGISYRDGSRIVIDASAGEDGRSGQPPLSGVPPSRSLARGLHRQWRCEVHARYHHQGLSLQLHLLLDCIPARQEVPGQR